MSFLERFRRKPPVKTEPTTPPLIHAPIHDMRGTLELELEREKKKKEHEQTLPSAVFVDEVYVGLINAPTFFDALNEKDNPEIPYSKDNVPTHFSISTDVIDQTGYNIEYDSRYCQRSIRIAKVHVDDTGGANYTICEGSISIDSKSDGFLRLHTLGRGNFFQFMPHIGKIERDQTVILEKMRKLSSEIFQPEKTA